MGLTIKQVIASRIVLRDKRAELKRAFDAEDRKLRTLEEQCETWLLQQANESGMDKFSVEGVGTAFRGTEMRVNCTDWPLLHKWAKENDTLDIFERRVSRKFVQEYQKANGGRLPPALNIVVEQTMNVRRTSAAITEGDTHE